MRLTKNVRNVVEGRIEWNRKGLPLPAAASFVFDIEIRNHDLSNHVDMCYTGRREPRKGCARRKRRSAACIPIESIYIGNRQGLYAACCYL